jgi:hypothetical protein
VRRARLFLARLFLMRRLADYMSASLDVAADTGNDELS